MIWAGKMIVLLLMVSLLNISIENRVIYKDESSADKNGIVETVFLIANNSSQPVNIISISPHCACTEFKLEKWKIDPGKKTNLILTVPIDQLKSLREVHAVIKTDSQQKFLKVSIKYGKAT
jgi:hypothetical protein